MQRSVRTDRHVGTHHVVVDGTDQADDDEGRMSVRELLRDDALGDQLSHVLGPFLRNSFVPDREPSPPITTR